MYAIMYKSVADKQGITREISRARLDEELRREDEQRTCWILEGVVSIGRAPGNTIRPPSPQVSKNHCQIQQKEGVWEVTDVGSTNGTFVNDDEDRITSARSLEAGDVVRCYSVSLRILLVTEDDQRPKADGDEGTDLSKTMTSMTMVPRQRPRPDQTIA